MSLYSNGSAKNFQLLQVAIIVLTVQKSNLRGQNYSRQGFVDRKSCICREVRTAVNV